MTPGPKIDRHCGADVTAQCDWVNVLGVRVSALNMTRAVGMILDAVARRDRAYVCIRDVHGVVRCQSDPVLRDAHNRALLVTPDGMPLVWILKALGRRDCGRVYGPDLMLALMARGRAPGLTHFLYGATPETLQTLQRRLLQRFPDLKIVGVQSPPFRPTSAEEDAETVERIRLSDADIVWVGLGTPKQELWMARMRARLDAPMLIGVGAAFNFHAGIVPQAPSLLQRAGLEWMFRLACEPRRLWRRYAVSIPSFLTLLTLQALRLRAFPIADEARAVVGQQAGSPLFRAKE